MIKRNYMVCFLIICALLFSGCSTTKKTEPSITSQNTSSIQDSIIEEEKFILEVAINSESIAKNILGEDSERKIYVYLPPSYYNSEKKYPVLYYLDGYSCKAMNFINSNKSEFDNEFNNGSKEFIVVALDGNTKAGGSFYANSPVSGNWEDFIVKEVTNYVDKNFRTINDSSARGISGYSMGGYGALDFAFKYPDVYSSVLVFGPGVFAKGKLTDVLDSWALTYVYKKCYAQAFSPNENNTQIFGNIPEFTGTPEDNAIIEDWNNGFGNWTDKIEKYITLNKQLKGIEIVYSETDEYKWIPEGCKELSQILTEKGLDNSLVAIEGGHIIPPDGVKNYFVRFFNKNLEY